MTTILGTSTDGQPTLRLATKEETKVWVYVLGPDGPVLVERPLTKAGKPKQMPAWVEQTADWWWVNIMRITSGLDPDGRRLARLLHDRVNYAVAITKQALTFQTPDCTRIAESEVRALHRLAVDHATPPAIAQTALIAAGKLSDSLRRLAPKRVDQVGGTPEATAKATFDPLDSLYRIGKIDVDLRRLIEDLRAVHTALSAATSPAAMDLERIGGQSRGKAPLPPTIELPAALLSAWTVYEDWRQALTALPWWSTPTKERHDEQAFAKNLKVPSSVTWWSLVEGVVFQRQPFSVVDGRCRLPIGRTQLIVPLAVAKLDRKRHA
jgi:hypothetical protein